jgi:hypothetical protein
MMNAKRESIFTPSYGLCFNLSNGKDRANHKKSKTIILHRLKKGYYLKDRSVNTSIM